MVPQLFLACDDLKDDFQQTMDDLQALRESNAPFSIKFNLDAMLNVRYPLGFIVERVKQFKRPVFADLKMWNGSRTMESVVKTFVGLEVDYLNVWASAYKGLAKAVKAAEGSNTKILGLTVLSHWDDADCQRWCKRTIAQAVPEFSRYAMEAGCHGIIAPGTTMDLVLHYNTMKMATGIRTPWYKDDRHKQEATPAEVTKAGAHFAVIGSPIFKQPSTAGKIAALHTILKEMRQAAA